MLRGKTILVLSAALLTAGLTRPIASSADDETDCVAQCGEAKRACIEEARVEGADCKQSCLSLTGSARGDCNRNCSDVFRAQKDVCLAQFQSCEQACEGATTTSTVQVTTTSTTVESTTTT